MRAYFNTNNTLNEILTPYIASFLLGPDANQANLFLESTFPMIKTIGFSIEITPFLVVQSTQQAMITNSLKAKLLKRVSCLTNHIQGLEIDIPMYGDRVPACDTKGLGGKTGVEAGLL